jgi:hypothetical protein
MSKKSTNTYAERLAAGLVQIGFHEVPSKSKKYREFNQPGFRKYFIGKAGALRAGDSASGSWSMGDPMHQTPTYKHVLREGDKALLTIDLIQGDGTVGTTDGRGMVRQPIGFVAASCGGKPEALSKKTKAKLASSGITACDVATLTTLAESDPLLARALGNL